MTWLIGRECKNSNVFSGPVLIGRGLGPKSKKTTMQSSESSKCQGDGVVDTSKCQPPEHLWRMKRCQQPRPPDMRYANQLSGGYRGGVPPVPFSNTEVKPSSADGTRGVSPRESRSPPENISSNQGLPLNREALCYT
jgi:hypothetical protein